MSKSEENEGSDKDKKGERDSSSDSQSNSSQCPNNWQEKNLELQQQLELERKKVSDLLSFQDKLRRELNKSRFQISHWKNEVKKREEIIQGSREMKQLKSLREDKDNLEEQVHGLKTALRQLTTATTTTLPTKRENRLGNETGKVKGNKIENEKVGGNGEEDIEVKEEKERQNNQDNEESEYEKEGEKRERKGEGEEEKNECRMIQNEKQKGKQNDKDPTKIKQNQTVTTVEQNIQRSIQSAISPNLPSAPTPELVLAYNEIDSLERKVEEQASTLYKVKEHIQKTKSKYDSDLSTLVGKVTLKEEEMTLLKTTLTSKILAKESLLKEVSTKFEILEKSHVDLLSEYSQLQNEHKQTLTILEDTEEKKKTAIKLIEAEQSTASLHINRLEKTKDELQSFKERNRILNKERKDLQAEVIALKKTLEEQQDSFIKMTISTESMGKKMENYKEIEKLLETLRGEEETNRKKINELSKTKEDLQLEYDAYRTTTQEEISSLKLKGMEDNDRLSSLLEEVETIKLEQQVKERRQASMWKDLKAQLKKEASARQRYEIDLSRMEKALQLQAEAMLEDALRLERLEQGDDYVNDNSGSNGYRIDLGNDEETQKQQKHKEAEKDIGQVGEEGQGQRQQEKLTMENKQLAEEQPVNQLLKNWAQRIHEVLPPVVVLESNIDDDEDEDDYGKQHYDKENNVYGDVEVPFNEDHSLCTSISSSSSLSLSTSISSLAASPLAKDDILSTSLTKPLPLVSNEQVKDKEEKNENENENDKVNYRNATSSSNVTNANVNDLQLKYRKERQERKEAKTIIDALAKRLEILLTENEHLQEKVRFLEENIQILYQEQEEAKEKQKEKEQAPNGRKKKRLGKKIQGSEEEEQKPFPLSLKLAKSQQQRQQSQEEAINPWPPSPWGDELDIDEEDECYSNGSTIVLRKTTPTSPVSVRNTTTETMAKSKTGQQVQYSIRRKAQPEDKERDNYESYDNDQNRNEIGNGDGDGDEGEGFII